MVKGLKDMILKRHQRWLEMQEGSDAIAKYLLDLEAERDEWIAAARYEKDEKLKGWSERNALKLERDALARIVFQQERRERVLRAVLQGAGEVLRQWCGGNDDDHVCPTCVARDTDSRGLGRLVNEMGPVDPAVVDKVIEEYNADTDV